MVSSASSGAAFGRVFEFRVVGGVDLNIGHVQVFAWQFYLLVHILIQQWSLLTHVEQFVGYVVGLFLLSIVVLGSAHHSDGVLSRILDRDL